MMKRSMPSCPITSSLVQVKQGLRVLSAELSNPFVETKVKILFCNLEKEIRTLGKEQSRSVCKGMAD